MYLQLFTYFITVLSVKKSKEKTQKKNKKSSVLIYIISFLLVIAGLCVFSYPVISNKLADINHTQAINTYDESIKAKTEEELDAEMQKAIIYNENLAGDPVHDPFVPGSGYALPDNYTDVLNTAGDGVMGYIEIPKISVKLPIYHGTSDEVLEKGVGHIESTALPIGGEGNHPVLTGHTGLPTAELFTRLTELKAGDEFYIHVLNEVLAYKVCEINVILPTDLDKLSAEEGRDLVTLVTCTPYGVNSHRLLVKGERTEYNPEKEASTKDSGGGFFAKYKYYVIGIAISFPILILIGIATYLYNKKRSKKDKNNDEKENTKKE